MKVTLVASTAVKPAMFEIMPDIGGPSTDGEILVTFAGRACYRSFDRPNPATFADRAYVKSTAIDKQHGSVLEHATATFYITGVSRALTHELIRHRAGTAFSELSQRYVDVADVEFVVPPAIREHGATPTQPMIGEDVRSEFDIATEIATSHYGWIVRGLEDAGVKGKKAREAARSVMPNAAATEIVMTANFRAWRHIIRLRGSEQADAEIREFAIEVLDQMYDEAPSVFGDFSIVKLDDGRQVIQ